MKRGGKGEKSGSEVWSGVRRDFKRSSCDKYGVGGRGQEKMMELGEELREGREIETKITRQQ